MGGPHYRRMDQPLLLGVDGGGTRCRVRIADAQGQTLGEGQGAAANVLSDPEGARASIEEAIGLALREAGLGGTRFEDLIAVLGLAGLDPADPRAPADWPLARFRACRVETDAYIAQAGAFDGDDGAILIVGTGSVGLLVRGAERISVGGYGAAVSDEGSGAWIGREAVRRALWAFDRRQPASRLTAAILAQVGEPPAAQAWATAARPADYATLAPLVFAAAQHGDLYATDLLREAADHLRRILARLADAGAREICLMGGLAEALRPWLKTAPIEIVAPRGAALDGALRLARGLALTQ